MQVLSGSLFGKLFYKHTKQGKVAHWLRHWAKSRKVTVSIPDGIIGIFHWHNPSGCTVALGLTQSLKEMSTRKISLGVKAAGAYGWQPYHLHVPIVLKSGSLNLLENPQGLSRPVMGSLSYLSPCNENFWSLNTFWGTPDSIQIIFLSRHRISLFKLP